MAGIDNDVFYGSNVDFSGSFPVSGQINLNGELLVGATTAPFIRPYVPVGSNGVSVTTGPGTIDFSLSNVPNGALQNSSITVTPGTGLSGGGGVSLGNSVSLSLSTPVSLAMGGTNANLTASNGGIFWSNASQAQILAGTATASQILLSGSNATPSWSTSTYPATNAINTLLYASSANVMSALATANSSVLTTNASGVPAWTQTPISSVNANVALDYVDDFIYSNTTSGTNGIFGPWQNFTNATGAFTTCPSTTPDANHPGQVQLSTSTSTTGLCFIDLSNTNTTACLAVGAGTFTITWFFQIVTLSNSTDRYTLVIGATDSNTLATPANGVFVTYSDNVNSGNWVFHTSKGSTPTNSNSSTPVSTGWQVIRITVNAAGSSVSFSAGTTVANLTSLGTAIATNIPTAAISPCIGIIKSVGGTARVINVDLFTMNISLTTIR